MKIKINNEEVVCDKNFTVSEEMLATSSVTLNNVYPKSWEETKDYVSNFYYPKDYSICKIYDETIIPYEPGTEVSGNPLYLTDVVASKIYQYKLYGYTKQNTYTGKNLFDINASLYSGTITKYNNGFTLIKGTNRTLSIMLPKPIQAGTYTINSNVITNTLSNINRMYIDFRTSSSSIYATTLNANGTKTFTLPSEVDRMYVYINNSEENTATITLDNVMISTNGGDYEPYVGGQPSPNPDYPQEVEVGRGKNLLPNYRNTSQTYEGIKYEVNSDGSVNVSGDATGYSRLIDTQNFLLKAGTYKLYNSFTAITGVYTELRNTSNTTITSTNSNTTFTLNQDTNIICRIYVVNGTQNVNATIYPMISINTMSYYLPYNTIEVKSTGKNLYDFVEGTYNNINGITAVVENGKITLNGTATANAFINLQLIHNINWDTTKRYTISCFNPVANSNVRLRVNSGGGMDTTMSVVNATKTVTPNNTDMQPKVCTIRVASGTTLNDFVISPMLEQGSTATEYEPYKETSIQYNLGDGYVADKDYIENGVLHKNIGKVVLNGSETWGTIGNDRYYITITDKRSLTTPVPCYLYSNYFNKTTNAGDTTNIGQMTEGYYTTGNQTVRFNYNGSNNDLAGFKTWLQTQYNNGNPVVVYYELAEETTVDLETEGELSLYDGINNVSADTDFTIDMLYNRVNGETIEDIIFNGLVKRTGNISLNPRDPHYCSLQVLDFKTFLSEGDVLNFVIANKTIEQAINMVVKAISSYGFVVGNIELDAKDDIIGAYSTDEKTAYDVFQYIADITNAKWFTRMIDEETIAIDFYDTDKLPNKGLIEYTNEWFCQNKIDDMSYSMDTNDYRNKQIILSDEVFGSTDYNETITATGYTTQFLTGGKIAKLNGATINSQTATIATNEEKEAGIEADIYYTPGENQFETAETQAQGIIIEISYTPLVKGREIVVNNQEVDRISSQLNRNGVISRYENRNDTTSSSELQQIGQSYIKYKGSPEITLKIVSRSNLYNVGDQVTFSSPLAELSTEYMVKKKSINYIATQSIIWYTFELSSNYNSESAINYFDNQRAKRAGNISESDYIIREIDINNTAQIKWQNTTITETTITGDNVLNAPLNAPLTQ